MCDNNKTEKRNRVLARLREIKSANDDPEIGHVEADALLLDLIDDPEITEVFNAIKRWYA